jgi:hypothetical protein
MKRESSPPVGQTLTARDLEVGQLEIGENGGAMFSPVELLALIQTRQIPIIEPGAWFDDRRLCAYAIDGDKIGSECCPNRGGNCCSLNGIPGQLCVFYEAREAAVWVAIRAYEGAR